MHETSFRRIQTIHWIYALLIVFFLSAAVFANRQVLLQPTNIEQISEAYSQSQYVLGENSPQKIDDSTVYLYAGYSYLQGENPTKVNFEQPPLGKYIFGLSYRLFHSSFVLNIGIYLGILVLFIILARQLELKHSFIFGSLITLVLTTSLQDHVGMALLDSLILLFSLMFMTVLFSRLKTTVYGFLLGLALGGIMATKYPFPLLFVYYAVLFLWLWWNKKWRSLLVIIPVSISVYLLSYTFFFLDHKSLVDLVTFEWYRFRWWTGERTIPKFLIFQTLFMGKFRAWWETNSVQYITDGDWRVTWPVLFILSVPASFQVIRIKHQKGIILFLYSTILLAVYAFGSASFGRYLLQILPFWILILALGLQTYVQKRTS